ncbi:MAG: hypothetical protein DIU60_007845 [Actinomycetes bacterium]|jgi:hypothetical protein
MTGKSTSGSNGGKGTPKGTPPAPTGGRRIRIRKPRPRTGEPPLDLRTPSGRHLPY